MKRALFCAMFVITPGTGVLLIAMAVIAIAVKIGPSLQEGWGLIKFLQNPGVMGNMAAVSNERRPPRR